MMGDILNPLWSCLAENLTVGAGSLDSQSGPIIMFLASGLAVVCRLALFEACSVDPFSL